MKAPIQNTKQKRSEMAYICEFQLIFLLKQILVQIDQTGCTPDSNVEIVMVC